MDTQYIVVKHDFSSLTCGPRWVTFWFVAESPVPGTVFGKDTRLQVILSEAIVLFFFKIHICTSVWNDSNNDFPVPRKICKVQMEWYLRVMILHSVGSWIINRVKEKRPEVFQLSYYERIRKIPFSSSFKKIVWPTLVMGEEEPHRSSRRKCVISRDG